MLVLLSFAVGCETPNDNDGTPNNNQGDPGPSVVQINDNIAWLSLNEYDIPIPFDEHFGLETILFYDGSSSQMEKLSEKLTEELREHTSRWRTIYCINQSTKEFHIYADKVLWGVAAGEPLEEYFIYCNNG